MRVVGDRVTFLVDLVMRVLFLVLHLMISMFQGSCYHYHFGEVDAVEGRD